MFSVLIPAQMQKYTGKRFNQIFAIIKGYERKKKRKKQTNSKFKLAQSNLNDKNKTHGNLESRLNEQL